VVVPSDSVLNSVLNSVSTSDSARTNFRKCGRRIDKFEKYQLSRNSRFDFFQYTGLSKTRSRAC
jgi:hypothetical protein